MIELRTLGALDLRGPDGQQIRSVLAQTKRLALLVYLATATPRGYHRKDALLALFWPDSDQERARASLRQVVLYLRRSLGEDMLVSRGDELGLEEGAVWSDVVAFEQAIEKGSDAEALKLYRGDFLPGFHLPEAPAFERWLEGERARLRSRASTAAWALAEREESAGNVVEAAVWARQALGLVPDDEAALRRLIKLLDRAGDHAGALRVYEHFARRLADEFAATPAAETRTLILSLGSGEGGATPAPEIRSAPELPSGAQTEASIQPRVEESRDGPERTPPPPAAASTQPAAGQWWRGRTGAVIGTVSALVLAIAVLVGLGRGAFTSDGNGNGAAERQLLIAEFQSPSGDPLLAQLVTDALAIDLSQSPTLDVVEPVSLRAALTRMGKKSDAVLDPALAREVAVREGIEAVVTGDVSRIGGKYLIAARLIDPRTEQTVAALRETATDSTDLIPAIDRLSRQLRTQMGESMRALRRSRPLEQVTTPSLSALRKYTQAAHAIDDEGDYGRGIALLQEAVAIDSGFAMAHRKLASTFKNTGEQSKSLDAAERAYRHRARLTERERYMTVGSYHAGFGQQGRAIEAYRSLVTLDPKDAYALNNLGLAYEEAGDFDRAAHYYRQAASVDTSFLLPFINLVLAEFNRGNIPGAEENLRELTRRFPESPWGLREGIQLAAARGDYGKAEALAQTLRTTNKHGLRWRRGAERDLAYLAAVRGRMSQAEAHMGAAMRAAKELDLPGQYLTHAVALGMIDIHARNAPQRALARVEHALREYPLHSLPPQDRPLVALAWLYADAGKPERARDMLAELQAISDPRLAHEIERKSRSIRGAIFLAEGQAQRAVAEMRGTQPADCTICLLPQLGRAYEEAGAPDSAIAAYERYLSTPFLYRLDSDAVWRPYVLQRLAALHERQGRRERAAQYRSGFVELRK